MQIALYDTSAGSPNIGDQIIMQSVERELALLFPYAFVSRLPTHDRIGKYGRRLLKKADLIVAGGTNLLFSHWRKYRQWRLTLADLAAIDRRLVLMGTGWTSYLSPPGFLARQAYKAILSPTLQHSVRDSYSKSHLATAGFTSVINTGCPTLWRLESEAMALIATRKGDRVITTLTDYRKDPGRDTQMLEVLKRNYGQVDLWMQGSTDLEYLRSLGVANINPIAPSLAAFDAELAQEGTDFVGTRLHAGIRALQKGRRTIIISVDNRAREMGRDFGLPVLERTDISFLEERIVAKTPLRIILPQSDIEAWRAQFSDFGNGIA